MSSSTPPFRSTTPALVGGPSASLKVDTTAAFGESSVGMGDDGKGGSIGRKGGRRESWGIMANQERGG